MILTSTSMHLVIEQEAGYLVRSWSKYGVAERSFPDTVHAERWEAEQEQERRANEEAEAQGSGWYLFEIVPA